MYHCPKCEAIFEQGVTYPKGPHIRLDCPECAAFIKFLPQSVNKFVMPIGKHKGKQLKDIPNEYLQWAVQAWIDEKRKKIAKRIKEYLTREI